MTTKNRTKHNGRILLRDLEIRVLPFFCGGLTVWVCFGRVYMWVLCMGVVLVWVAEMYGLVVPWPGDERDLLWFALGLQFGRSFGKKLDYEIQQGDWFKRRHPFWQGTVKRLLDFTHHWWVGYILWVYAGVIAVWLGQPCLTNEIFWFGVGLLVDDLPDLYRRIRGGIKNIQAYMKETQGVGD